VGWQRSGCSSGTVARMNVSATALTVGGIFIAQKQLGICFCQLPQLLVEFCYSETVGYLFLTDIPVVYVC
jgi:hypothetical protein